MHVTVYSLLIGPSLPSTSQHTTRDSVPDAPAFSTTRYSLILGLLSTAGPIGTDLYLPFFPAIQRGLSCSAAQLQLSLVGYFVALAVGQLIYGPVADRYGRRLPLLIGFTVSLAASVGAALAPSIELLICWRFLQGLGASSGMVIARSIARDLGSGTEVARLFSMMALVLGVSPILAPSLGAALLAKFPWQATFWCMAAIAAACLLSICFGLRETLALPKRSTNLAAAFVVYRRLLTDRAYLRAVLTGGFAIAGFFAYIAGSPDVLFGIHHLSAAQYSLVFGMNSVALIGASQFLVPLLARASLERLVSAVTAVYAMLALMLLSATLSGIDSLAVTAVLFFWMNACMGLMFPLTSIQAVEHHPDGAGAASALMGAIQFGFGALAGAGLSAISDGSALPLAATIAICALSAVATNYLARPTRIRT